MRESDCIGGGVDSVLHMPSRIRIATVSIVCVYKREREREECKARIQGVVKR